MLQFIKKILFAVLVMYSFFCILYFRENCASSVTLSMTNWFVYVVPVLFPGIFLITLSLLLVPPKLLTRGKLVPILAGNIMGIPCGAIILTDLCQKRILSSKEASFLLPVCSNLGIHFLIGIILPNSYGNHMRHLVIFYVIHIILSIIIWLLYVLSLNKEPVSNIQTKMKQEHLDSSNDSFTRSNVKTSHCTSQNNGFISSLMEAISQTIEKMVIIGGFMIISNLIPILFLPFDNIYQNVNTYILCIIEISSGAILMKGSLPEYTMAAASFGGVSCLLQIAFIIQKEKISIFPFFLFKVISFIVLFIVFRYIT